MFVDENQTLSWTFRSKRTVGDIQQNPRVWTKVSDDCKEIGGFIISLNNSQWSVNYAMWELWKLTVTLIIAFGRMILPLLLILGSDAEVRRRSCHGSAPALGVTKGGVPWTRPSFQSTLLAMTIISHSRMDLTFQGSLCSPDQTPGTSPYDQLVAVGIVVSCR